MLMVRRLLGAMMIASVALAACGPTDAKSPSRAPARARVVPLTIVTSKGALHYKVEVATSPAEQAKGLMYRTSLPENGGMIFPMTPPRFASFWMKNTLIPLDIIFIRPDRTIESIAANARPQDLTPLESGEPVAAVLEIVGGDAARIGIAPGDKVSW